jgi:hypothetical protein
MVGLSPQQTGAGVMLKNLVALCVGLMMIISGSIAMAHDGGGGETKVLKSKESGSFVSTNFDFDHPDLSTPANYINSAGTGDVGQFTSQAVNEYTPDLNMKTCTVPGGVANAATEFTLVQDVGLDRFTETGDLLFFKSTSGTACQDFSTFPTPPFPFTFTETGVITGGTGKYSGATGTYTAKGKGAELSLDATAVRGFGWFKNSGVTTITLKEE